MSFVFADTICHVSVISIMIDDDDGSTVGKCVYLYRMKEGMSAHD